MGVFTSVHVGCAIYRLVTVTLQKNKTPASVRPLGTSDRLAGVFVGIKRSSPKSSGNYCPLDDGSFPKNYFLLNNGSGPVGVT